MNNNLHRRRVSEQVKGGGGVVVPDYWDAGKYRPEAAGLQVELLLIVRIDEP